MRIATYNVEWFDHLFDDLGRLRSGELDPGWQGASPGQRVAALTAVFRAIDADAVMIIEAPDRNKHRDTVRALETFAAHAGLRTNRAAAGFPTETQQEIGFLYDPAKISVTHDPQGTVPGRRGGRGSPRFDGVFRVDLDDDGRDDLVRWSKPPLELAATVGTRTLRLIGVHAKSKAPHGARNDADVTRMSVENRRKQLAQCIWLRQRVVEHLTARQDLIVLGDFNDGPGLDEYEALFGRSGVEVVMGEKDAPRLHDPHVALALSRKFAAPPTSARFRLPDGAWLQALIDYIMVSPGLLDLTPRWRIWHPFDDPACFADTALRDALLAASDHFPVTLDIAL